MQAVDGVSLSVERGQDARHRRRVGLGQERHGAHRHGAHARSPNATIAGAILFEGDDLLTLPTTSCARIRGNDIAMIFQDPLSSLHPFYKVGEQLVEAIRAHRDVSRRREARERAIELLALVGIPDADARRVDATRTSSPAACASA